MIYQSFILIAVIFFAFAIHNGVIPRALELGAAAFYDLDAFAVHAARGIAAGGMASVAAVKTAASESAEAAKETIARGVAVEEVGAYHLLHGGEIFALRLAEAFKSFESWRNFRPAEKTEESSAPAKNTEPIRASAPLPSGVPHEPTCGPQITKEISAQAFLLYDFDRGVPLALRNERDPWPLASLTKLMTSVIAIESFSLNAKITVGEQAAALEGRTDDIRAGDTFSLYDLLHAMLIASSNRAAEAVAESKGKNIFVDAMQAKANELGMTHTSYTEPTGLSFLNRGTAADLYKLVVYILRYHPELLEISREPYATLTEMEKGVHKTVATVDSFAGDLHFIGGKTGYTDEAQRNFAGVFRIKNDMIVSIVLGSDNAILNTRELLRCIP